MAVPVAAAVTAAGSVIGAGINAAAQGKMNKRTERYNKWAMSQQRGWALEDWERQNIYNSPAQQMQRLREAGLNPHLIYGGGQPTNTASAVQSTNINPWNPKTPDVGAILTDPVNAYMETRSFQAQQKLIDANTLKALAEVDTKNFDLSQKQRLADTQAAIMNEILTGKKIDNTLNRDENIRRNLTTSSNLQEAFTRMAKMESEMDLNAIMQEKGNEDIKNTRQMRRKVEQEIEGLKRDNKIKDFEIQLNKAGFTKNDPVYFRMAKTIYDAVNGKNVQQELEAIRQDILKNQPKAGLSVYDALKNLIYGLSK